MSGRRKIAVRGAFPCLEGMQWRKSRVIFVSLIIQRTGDKVIPILALDCDMVMMGDCLIKYRFIYVFTDISASVLSFLYYYLSM